MENLVLIRFGNLSKTEVGQFGTRLVSDYDKSGMSITDEMFLQILSDMRSHLAAYNQSQEKVTTTQSAAVLAAADEARDEDLSALFAAIKPFEGSRDPEEQEAYAALAKIFNEHKKTARLHYEAETGDMNHLLEKLKDAKIAEYISFLGLNRFVTRLTKSQAAFEEIFSERSQDKLVQPLSNYRQLRETLITDYTDLSEHVELLARRSKAEDYAPLLDLINQVRKHYAEIIHKRKGRSKAKVETTDTPVESKE